MIGKERKLIQPQNKTCEINKINWTFAPTWFIKDWHRCIQWFDVDLIREAPTPFLSIAGKIKYDSFNTKN